MSLVHCPECGQEVSNQAKKCIHCGVSLFICPECGKISIGEGKCTGCGYTVAPAVKAPTENKSVVEPSYSRSFTVVDRWRANDLDAKKVQKVFTILGWGILILGWVLTIIWFFQIFNDYLDTSLGNLLQLALNHEDNLESTNHYCIGILIVSIGETMLPFIKSCYPAFSCAKWIRGNKIEVGEDISMLYTEKAEEDEEETFEEDSDEESKNTMDADEKVDLIKSSIFLAVDPNQSVFYCMLKAIPYIVSMALQIFALVCCKDNATAYMESVLMGDYVDNGNGGLVFTIDYSFDWKTLLIGLAIFAVLWIATTVICDFIREKRMDKTLQKLKKVESK